MTMIRVKKDWKDFAEKCTNPMGGLTRRDFIARGMLTGGMSVMLPKILAGGLIKQAFADSTGCPAPTRVPGAIAQLHGDGGYCVGGRIITSTQAGFMNATVAANYGVTGKDQVALGTGGSVSSTSAFGTAILTAPAGFSAAAWAQVLANTGFYGHFGPSNMDDGAGQNLGFPVAGSGKVSAMNKDIRIANNVTPASWATSVPGASISGNNLQPSSLSNVFSLIPSNMTNSATMANTANAAQALTGIFAGLFNLSARKGGTQLMTAANCGFQGDAVIASPTYGASLFTPSQVPALSSGITLSSLTNEEQAQLAAFYNSAIGNVGVVVNQFNGRDYHGSGAQNTATLDYEEGRAVAMFLASCAIAGTRGALIFSTNGQAIANGVAAATVGPNNNINVQGNLAAGDAGGSGNALSILLYDPNGGLPPANFTGSFNTSNGNVKADPNISSVPIAMAGLYLTALKFMGGNVGVATSAIQAAGITLPSNAILI